MKKLLLILIIILSSISCKKQEKEKVNISPAVKKEQKKEISYLVVYHIYEYPYIFSENRFDKITSNDVEWERKILVNGVIEVENYNQSKGYKVRDGFSDQVYEIMRRMDSNYKRNDLRKIYDSYEKREASSYKSKIVEKEIKVFSNYKDASEYKYSLIN